MAGKKGMHDKYRFGEEYQQKLRAKIKVHRILDILNDHVVNGTDIAASRLTTGLGLLKKALPDLQSTESTITHKTTFVDALKRIEQADKLIPNDDGLQSNDSPRVTH